MSKRLRFDLNRFRVEAEPERASSGRRLVIGFASVLVVLLIVLWVAFRGWRAGYEALAEYGRTQVAPTVDLLIDRAPPGVPPQEWRRDVADTHAMLETVASLGRLDRAQLEAMRADLERRVSAATPETVVGVLRGVWDDMEKRAPILSRKTSRPPHPPSRPKRFLPSADALPAQRQRP